MAQLRREQLLEPGREDSTEARQKLEAAASINALHWLIVGLSLLLTFFAWSYSKSQRDIRVRAQFDREAEHVVELIRERMQKYEEVLWGGVALIRANGGDVDYQRWKQYAESIQIETRYPGINGIGVVKSITRESLPEFLAEERKQRPGFTVHPEHGETSLLPIAYIIPVAPNAQAVGLDLAHESNRLAAAGKACDSGLAQITGPITLVQDSGRTPGFLFYAPFYRDDQAVVVEDRRQAFGGMVYAPFVVGQLMRGVLEREKRHVGLRLSDGDDVLYDEHQATEADFDPKPLFKKSLDLGMNGRTWTFDIWSAQSFRKAVSDSQPATILIGGLVIDSLLIFFFVSLSRASHKALQYADSMTEQLQQRTEELEASKSELSSRASQLETSNQDLEQFAYVASHDLQEPLRKICSYGELLIEESGDSLNNEGRQCLDIVISGATRMKRLVNDLLAFARVTSKGAPLVPTLAQHCLETALENLDLTINERGAEITSEPLPMVLADPGQLAHLFQNLISNAIKYTKDEPPRVHIGARDRGNQVEIFVRDNGIGIEPEFQDRVFEIFQRLHNRRDYGGTGIGLAICKRIVQRFGGQMWLKSEPGTGSTFYFTVGKKEHDGKLRSERLEPVGSTD